ncbi:hypothetical protein C8F01DRAFT_1137048 [Mycena amicta]|nr:hypothetical protein C8F01DRAFT_1137048 [Mycena amicta]
MDALATMLAQSASHTFEAQAKTLLTAAEANVARIDSQIRDLVCLRERERASIAVLKFVTSPIRKVPTELLVEIFLCTVLLTGNRSPLLARLVLSQVSTYWRAVALRTPQLWAIELPIKLGRDTPEYIATAKLFLERSHPFPVPVRLVKGPSARKISQGLLDAAASVAHRWSSLHIEYVDISAALKRLPSPIAMPHLENMSMELLSAGYTDAFLGASKLRSVTLASAHIDLLPLPWPQLTHLYLSHHAGQKTLEVLLQCNSLIKAEISAFRWPTRPPMPTTTAVVLPHLQNLTLDVESSRADSYDLLIEPYFWHLSLPALETLDMSVNVDYSWTPSLSIALSQFLARAPRLVSFELHSANIEATDLLALLAATPALTKLRLDFCRDCICDFVLQGLTYAQGQPLPLVPHLEELLLDDVGDLFSDELEALAAVIESRWWPNANPAPVRPVARLRRVYVWVGDLDDDRMLELSADLQARLTVMTNEGLQVTVH